MASDAIPATGAWRPGMPPGRRRFVTLFTDAPLRLELGGELGPITVAYETWGELDEDRSNAVLVCHALTGDSHVAGPAAEGHATPGWWDGLVGPGRGLDPERSHIVCPNVLGGCQGTTGPASLGDDGRAYGSRFPAVTIRDMVRVELALSDVLGIDRWAGVIGGSMGGMQVLEWQIMAPERVAHGIPIATGAAASAEQIALQTTQVRAIRLDPGFRGGDYYDAEDGDGPHEGLGLARRVGHLSYRTEDEVRHRFGRLPQGDEDPRRGGRYAIESYLDHHARKLARRFDANTYIRLTDAMTHHDVGRGRGGIAAALGRITSPTTVVAVDSDRLYPPYLQHEVARLVPGAGEVVTVPSAYGHDGFLIETDALTPTVRAALYGD